MDRPFQYKNLIVGNLPKFLVFYFELINFKNFGLLLKTKMLNQESKQPGLLLVVVPLF